MTQDSATLSKWFQERPFWIQEAVRRLLADGNLSDADLKQLADICKRQGRAKKGGQASIALPAAAFGKTPLTGSVRLKAISEVKGIEALNPRKPLAFHSEQVTIVYGSNGAGKSGYIRILNNACGGRNRRPLLGNVFRGDAAQSCRIGYTVGGAAKETAWTPTVGVLPDLRGVEIYDNECAQVYITEENEVAYEPWLLGLFRQLVEACDRVARIIDDEIAALPSKKPVMPPEYAATAHAAWYDKISAEIDTNEVEQHSAWPKDHQKVLDGMRRRLAEKNPADQAKRLRAQKTAAQKLSSELARVSGQLDDSHLDTLFAAKTDAAVKKKAATVDAKKVFAQAPLEGVGLESWKLLWEQARAYSEALAYKEQTFPFTGKASRCVLCQQPLDDDARNRLISFERFVKGELESQAKTAEARATTLVNGLPRVPDEDSVAERLASAGVDDDAIAAKILRFRRGLQTRRDKMEQAPSKDDVPSTPSSSLLADLPSLIDTLETQAKAYDEDAKKADRTELRNTAKELEAQKWLNEQKTSIEAEIARLRRIQALEAAKRLANTTALSTKKSELSQSLVSDAFIRRFHDELKALSASRIRVELVQTRATKGRVWHQIRLKDAKIESGMSDVLSDGERRIVSIAAFLADVEGIEASTPFVFDDPISSLDQDYEEAVVARLAALAKNRQVIVFTHRLSLLTLLEDAAKDRGISTRVVALNQEAWGTGEPSETPFSAQRPGKVVNVLLNERLAKARNVLNESGRAEFDILAKGICSDIRILVERIVEDTLINEVVRRFRRAVQTYNRIANLAKITPDDCKLIDDLMAKYSRFEHSQPNDAPVPLPDPDEIDSDLKQLRDWLKEFESRPVPKP